MSFFKNLLQSFLKEEDGNRSLVAEKTFVVANKTKTSKIVNKLEKGNNGIFGDEYEEDEKLLKSLIEETDNLLLEEEEEDDDDANYRDKDKEAKKAYIEKMKKKALLKAEKIKKDVKKDSKKGGSGKKENDWGKRTSERNLNREIGGMERDYAKELREELQMRSNKRKALRRNMEALRVVIRRRLKRMHINRRFLMNYHRTIVNIKKIRNSLKKIGVVIRTKNANKIKNMKLGQIKQRAKQINKAKKIAKAKKVSYIRSNEEMKKKYLEEYKKAQKTVAKQQKSNRSMGISI